MTYSRLMSHSPQARHSSLSVSIMSAANTDECVAPKLKISRACCAPASRRTLPKNFRLHQPAPNGSAFVAWLSWQSLTNARSVVCARSIDFPQRQVVPPGARTVARNRTSRKREASGLYPIAHEFLAPVSGNDAPTANSMQRHMVERAYANRKQTTGDNFRTPDDFRTQDFKRASQRTACPRAVKVYPQAAGRWHGLHDRCGEGVAREEASSVCGQSHQSRAFVSERGRFAQRHKAPNVRPGSNARSIARHATRRSPSWAGRRSGSRMAQGMAG